MTYLGIEIVDIPSGMGGTLPAAVANEFPDGTMNVICLHREFFPNWVLTVNRADVKPCTYRPEKSWAHTINSRRA